MEDKEFGLAVSYCASAEDWPGLGRVVDRVLEEYITNGLSICLHTSPGWSVFRPCAVRALRGGRRSIVASSSHATRVPRCLHPSIDVCCPLRRIPATTDGPRAPRSGSGFGGNVPWRYSSKIMVGNTPLWCSWSFTRWAKLSPLLLVAIGGWCCGQTRPSCSLTLVPLSCSRDCKKSSPELSRVLVMIISPFWYEQSKEGKKKHWICLRQFV